MHTSRRQRRAIAAAPNVTDLDAAMRRHPSNQAPPAGVPAHSLAAPARRGLVKRARAALVRRQVERHVPALVPRVVAAAGALILVGIVIGVALGVALVMAALETEQ
jgi:hypothetical protein